MSDAITVQITGLDELARNLQRVPAVLAKTTLREGLHAAGDVMIAAAEGTAPVRTGELAADIVSKVYVDPGLQFASVRVGPGYNRGELTVRGTRANSHRPGGVEAIVDTSESPGVYGKFVELGHRMGHRSGKEIEQGSGNVPPHPWLRPAFEASAETALGTFIAYVRAGLEAIAGAVR